MRLCRWTLIPQNWCHKKTRKRCQNTLPIMWRHSWEVAFWKPKGAVTRTWLQPPRCQTCSLQNGEVMTFCCLSHPVHDILLWQPELTNAKAQIIHSLGPALTGLFWKVFVKRWQLAEKWMTSEIQSCKIHDVPGRVNRKCKGLKVVNVASLSWGWEGRGDSQDNNRPDVSDLECESVSHRKYGRRLRKVRLWWEYKRNLHLF